MVNSVVVNGRERCVFYVHFCKFFLAFAHFLHFKSTVKYKRILYIN